MCEDGGNLTMVGVGFPVGPPPLERNKMCVPVSAGKRRGQMIHGRKTALDRRDCQLPTSGKAFQPENAAFRWGLTFPKIGPDRGLLPFFNLSCSWEGSSKIGQTKRARFVPMEIQRGQREACWPRISPLTSAGWSDFEAARSLDC